MSGHLKPIYPPKAIPNTTAHLIKTKEVTAQTVPTEATSQHKYSGKTVEELKTYYQLNRSST
jgi:hypothetical protein